MTQVINRQQKYGEDSWLHDQWHMASEKFLRKTGAFRRIMLQKVETPADGMADCCGKHAYNSSMFTGGDVEKGLKNHHPE